MKNKDVVSRFIVMQNAYRYGIKGSVQRKGVDELFIIAEGEESSIEEFINWCETFQLNFQGCVTLEEKEIVNYKSFDIIRNRNQKL
ncbi:MAG: acylphosphatase [Bacteroidales bacterium]|nr:acylphosphatase [Bacteroidales bacterium]